MFDTPYREIRARDNSGKGQHYKHPTNRNMEGITTAGRIGTEHHSYLTHRREVYLPR